MYGIVLLSRHHSLVYATEVIVLLNWSPDFISRIMNRASSAIFVFFFLQWEKCSIEYIWWLMIFTRNTEYIHKFQCDDSALASFSVFNLFVGCLDENWTLAKSVLKIWQKIALFLDHKAAASSIGNKSMQFLTLWFLLA